MFWFLSIPVSPWSLERTHGLPHQFRLPFIKYLSGIFLSLARRSFNITLDILSFMDGNRGRTGGIKISHVGRQAAAGPGSGRDGSPHGAAAKAALWSTEGCQHPTAQRQGAHGTEARGRGHTGRLPAASPDPAHCLTCVRRLCCSCMGLVINLQAHQQHDESVPRQDHVSSPPSWAAFKISAAGVTRRARSRRPDHAPARTHFNYSQQQNTHTLSAPRDAERFCHSPEQPFCRRSPSRGGDSDRAKPNPRFGTKEGQQPQTPLRAPRHTARLQAAPERGQHRACPPCNGSAPRSVPLWAAVSARPPPALRIVTYTAGG